jgi:hypothetical protein
LNKYEELIKGVRGHAVQYPILFLTEEDRIVSAFRSSYYLPEIGWT